MKKPVRLMEKSELQEIKDVADQAYIYYSREEDRLRRDGDFKTASIFLKKWIYARDISRAVNYELIHRKFNF